MKKIATIVVGLAVASGVVVAPSVAQASVPRFKNCTALHKRYVHGVGLPGAHDKKRSGKRVTRFYKSKPIYAANKKLDADHDGIACEK